MYRQPLNLIPDFVPAARQLTLDLGHRIATGREDFLISPCNQDAVAWIDLWPKWPMPVLVLHGPPASGKSHLAAVWAAHTGGLRIDAASLLDADLRALTEGNPHLAIEDVDALIGERQAETALFHLFNMIRESVTAGGDSSLLLLARLHPIRMDFIIPDLASRLRGAPAAGILPPDDDLLGALLVKLFADRQLRVGQDVIHYILPRMDRSFAAARDLVAAIDESALEQHRNISIPLVRSLLPPDIDPAPEITQRR